MTATVKHNTTQSWKLWAGGIVVGLAVPPTLSVFTTAAGGLMDLVDRGITMVMQTIASIPL